MNTLPERLKRALSFDGKAVAAEIDDCWPKEPDDAEISNESALRLLAYVVHWNHQRYAPIHERLIEIVRALESSNKTILYLMEEYAMANGVTVGYRTVDHNNAVLTALSEVLSGKGDEK